MQYYFGIIFILISLNLKAQWINLQQGTNEEVEVFFVDTTANLLFVGGCFTSAGLIQSNSIATWDGSTWNSFGNGDVISSPGCVSAITKYNGSIIIGGYFDSIGTKEVNNVALWNGQDWEPIGAGFDGGVEDLIVYNGELYAGGFFAHSGSDTVRAIAKWNGNNWVRILDLFGYVYTFSIYHGVLVIGGSFWSQQNSHVGQICGWNGISIDTSFYAFNSSIYKLRNFDDTLYAVGTFTSNSMVNSKYISIYYNNLWHSIGNPTGGQNSVTDVVKFNSSLYFCGYFLNPPDLCMYNGSGFDSVADVIGFLKVMVEYKNVLYIGGRFNQLNGQIINNIAKYTVLNFISEEESNIMDDIYVYPSLTNDGIINISSINETYLQNSFIEIYSSDSKKVWSCKKGEITNTLNLHLDKGIYFLLINNDMKCIKVQKIIKI